MDLQVAVISEFSSLGLNLVYFIYSAMVFHNFMWTVGWLLFVVPFVKLYYAIVLNLEFYLYL